MALGATPQQVWIDGIPQLETPTHAPLKSSHLQKSPKTPNFDKETKTTLEFDGLPPLLPTHSEEGVVVFTNFSRVYIRHNGKINEIPALTSDSLIVVERGEIICHGSQEQCSSHLRSAKDREATFVDLQGGSISPGLVAFGSTLGLNDIAMAEPSTQDGEVYDPIYEDLPSILGNDPIMHAADGLQYATRDALYDPPFGAHFLSLIDQHPQTRLQKWRHHR